MKKTILFMAAAVLVTACGGPPAPSRPVAKNPAAGIPAARKPDFLQEPGGKKAFSQETLTELLGEEAYVLNREEYPGLYPAGPKIEKVDLEGLNPAFGNPADVSVWWLKAHGYGLLIYLKPKTAAKPAENSIRQVLLYHAMKTGNSAKIGEILGKGLDLNATETYGMTMLNLVFHPRHEMPNQLALVRVLLAGGADPNSKGWAGRSLLHQAVRSSLPNAAKKQMVSMLLKGGADPNAVSFKGYPVLTAVLKADFPDKQEILAMLIAGGADPQKVGKSGQSLVHEALGVFRKFNPPRLEGRNGTETRGIQEAGVGKVTEDLVVGWLDALITDKTDLNARNWDGKTPLGLAFLADGEKLQRYLLKKGARDFGLLNPSYDIANANGLNTLGLGSAEIFGLNREQCHHILKLYKVKFQPLPATRGVRNPIRLKGAIGGIKYRHIRNSRKFSIMDCRLAVALAGWAPVLKKHQVTEIVHMRAYSPGSRVGGGKKVSGHNFALALDVSHLIFRDARKLSVKKHWKDHSRIDPCEKPGSGKTPRQKRLRRITCETGEFDLFSVILTPHFNRAHYDHLHMELDDTQYMFIR